MQDPAGLEELHRTLRSLRHADTEVAALLFAQGFGAQVADNAARVARWLGEHLARPADDADMLARGRALTFWTPAPRSIRGHWPGRA